MLTHNLKSDNGNGVLSDRVRKGLQKELGVEVTVLTTIGSGLPFEKAILSPNKLKLIGALPRIRRIIKNCDAIHALDAYPYGILAALAAYGLGKKLIVTAVGTGSIQLLYHRRFPGTQLVKWVYRRAAAVTAISRFTKDAILRHMPELRIEVINPGVDYEKFLIKSDEEKDADACMLVQGSTGQTYAVGDLRPYVLSVGSIRWRKGYKLSLKSFARIHDKFPQLKYVIVGKRYAEKYYEELLRIVRELHLETAVVFLDQVDAFESLRALYRNAELFCLLSQNFGHDVEGFGIVFLEAAAAGLPVVGSMENGVEDAVEDGKNGFLVNCRDEEDFADKIMAVLGSPKLRSEMGRASLTWARVSSWDKKIGEYCELYRKLFGLAASALPGEQN